METLFIVTFVLLVVVVALVLLRILKNRIEDLKTKLSVVEASNKENLKTIYEQEALFKDKQKRIEDQLSIAESNNKHYIDKLQDSKKEVAYYLGVIKYIKLHLIENLIVNGAYPTLTLSASNKRYVAKKAFTTVRVNEQCDIRIPSVAFEDSDKEVYPAYTTLGQLLLDLEKGRQPIYPNID